ncbi:MAG: nicotinate-nucleotide adenylyltransferase [Pseudomonadota bacterium]
MIGFLGGTFDPVHLGHTHAATSVREALGLDEVRMVLAARPGHRQPPQAAVTHRWQMLQLACAEHAGLVADDSELERQGHSYTVDTLRAFHQQYPNTYPVWILGQDAFATLAEWYQWQDLMQLCNLVVVERPGDERAEPAAVEQLERAHRAKTLRAGTLGQIVRLPLSMQEVSATQIRHKIAHGAPFEHLLAGPVCTYIKTHDLYATLETAI